MGIKLSSMLLMNGPRRLLFKVHCVSCYLCIYKDDIVYIVWSHDQSILLSHAQVLFMEPDGENKVIIGTVASNPHFVDTMTMRKLSSGDLFVEKRGGAHAVVVKKVSPFEPTGHPMVDDSILRLYL